MDANDTRYHAFITRADWAMCYTASDDAHVPHPKIVTSAFDALPDGTDWQANALTLQPKVYEHLAAPNDAPPTPQDRHGAARDRFGNVYWIDAARTAIRVSWSSAQAVAHFWRTGDGVACEAPNDDDAFEPSCPPTSLVIQALSGLAVTDDHYLVVGVLEPQAGLLIFDLHGGGAPQFMIWPAEIAFAPSDLAARPGGGVWILDEHNARLWALDGRWQVVSLGTAPAILLESEADDFVPTGVPTSDSASAGLNKPVLTPQSFSASAAYALTGYTPFAVAGLPDCSVLLLDNDGSGGRGQVRLLQVELGGTQVGLPVALRLPAHDFAFVPEYETPTPGPQPDQLFVALQHGNQALSYTIHLTENGLMLTETTQYWPMRLFGGKALVAGRTAAYYDMGERWLPLIEMKKAKHVSTATFYTPVLDGREPDCVWHRLLLDGCLPPETQVNVRSRASNDATQWVEPWHAEPALYLRGDGSELPFAPGQRRDAQAGNGTWELLIQAAHGQFIQLEITLAGDGRVTPQVRALRLYYPRFSYSERYLPAIYRDPELTNATAQPNHTVEAATFLSRFLANFEGLFTAIEDRIAAAQVLLDARSAPADALAWLADWLGMALDPAWNVRTRRLFIRYAMHFFQYRGTRHGLIMALRLALDSDNCLGPEVFESDALNGAVQPSRYRITEAFRTRTQTTLLAIRDAAHQFVVSLPVVAAQQSGQDETERQNELQRQLALARRVIALEKPAHTDFTVRWYWALFRVGEARLGEDSLIGLGSRSPELMKPAVLGQSYLIESYIAGA